MEMGKGLNAKGVMVLSAKCGMSIAEWFLVRSAECQLRNLDVRKVSC